MRPLSATVDPAALRAELVAGGAVLVCERPALLDGRGDCGGPLLVEGFVAAPEGIASVEVQIANRGEFAAEVGLARPDARLVLGDHPEAKRPGFRAEIDTAGWAPGTLDIRIVARGHAGSEAIAAGHPRWFPGLERFVEPARAGRCALMWVDPVLAAPVGEAVYVGGAASSAAGIEHVEIEGPGVGLRAANLRPILPATATYYGVLPTWGVSYGLRLDLRDVPIGSYPLSVTAIDRAGDRVRVDGLLTVDPAERYARWRGGSPASPTTYTAWPRLAVERISNGYLGDILRRVAATEIPTLLVDAETDVTPRAAMAVAAMLDPLRDTDAVYGDEDVLGDDGRPAPSLKPGWSPELLFGRNYVGGVVGVGPRAASAALTGWDEPPADLYELMLRLVDEEVRVERIPDVLGRRKESSIYHDREQERAVAAVARRRGRECVRDQTPVAGAHQVRWPLRDRPLVSIVIPTLGRDEPLGTCLESLVEQTEYSPWEVVLVDSGTGAADQVAARRLPSSSWRTVAYDRPEFNFSRAVNLGTAAARGEYVLYLNDDTTFPDREWLEALVEYATLPKVGAVGPLLTYPGGTVQCAGVLLTGTGEHQNSTPLHAWRALPDDAPGLDGVCVTARDVAVISGACMLVARDVVESVGGWDELFRMDYGDIDLSARIGAAGHRIVCVPWARVLHVETATRANLPDHRDRLAFHDRWGRAYKDGDPFHHPAYRHSYEGELRIAGVDA